MDADSVPGIDRVPHGGSDDPDCLDLSANTNPRVPGGAEAVYREAFAASRRYPDDDYAGFRAAAAAHVAADVDPAQVVPTAGGTVALRLAMATTLSPGDSVLLPAPSFGEYAREARLQGADPSFVAPDAVLDADPGPHALVVVCTPNNPTGETVAPDALRAYAERCRARGTTLLVDEAFLGFTDLASVAGTPGVVVARSLTKLFGLPGLRAGFAVATGDHLVRLQRARPAWSLGTPAACVGEHCLRDRGFVVDTRERVARERRRLVEGLDAAGFDPRPSDAPFVLVDCGDRDVDRVLETAREAGVVLRDARTFRGLDSHVRVAVKDAAATDAALDALGGDGR
jgi:threonine-phosphate decarboxylase